MGKEEVLTGQKSRLEEREGKLQLNLELEDSRRDILVTIYSNGRAVIYDPDKGLLGLASLETGKLQLELDVAMIGESLPYLNAVEIKQVLSFIKG